MKLSALSLSLIAFSSVAYAQRPDRGGPKLELPQELKDAFARAVHLKFSGKRVVTFVRAGKVETHSEYVTKDGENLRIEFDKGSPYAGQIIVETADSRKHYFPDKNEIRVYPSFGKRQFEGFRGMFRSPRGGKIRFDSASGGMVAGLKCTRYQLSDKDNNPIVQIYLEPRSGMITKRVLFDPTGNIAGSYEFVNLTLTPRILPGSFVIARKGATIIRPIDELRKQAGTFGLPALTLKGNTPYKLESVYPRDIKGSQVIVQNFVGPDSRITLFITKSNLGPSDLRKYQRGELSTHVWTLNGITLVLIGDQPEDKLRSLAGQVSD